MAKEHSTYRTASVRLITGGLCACLLAVPAWSQATSAGAAKAQAAVAATSVAAPADGPDTLLIKKKKKVVLKPVPAAEATASEQPPVALDGAKAVVNAESAPAATVATAAAVPEVVKVPAKMTKKDAAKTAAVTAAKPAAGDASTPQAKKTAAITPAKPARKAVSVSPDTPPDTPTGCRTRSFLVNDYGKDGPTADAKRLLDADIASWAKANNLANIKVGPKSVKCDQFLNFIVFDEWTCTASAKVCWQ